MVDKVIKKPEIQRPSSKEKDQIIKENLAEIIKDLEKREKGDYTMVIGKLKGSIERMPKY